MLAADYEVVVAARRTDKIEKLAAEIGGRALGCDITDPDQVSALADAIGDRLDLLVNNAGGALGQEPVAEADVEAWIRMYDTNVIGTVRVTKALLPALRKAEGTIVFITSVAAEAPYEGGAGYCGAKAAERMIAGAMRLELCGEPVRVCEIVPGMVMTDEFSLTRFSGDAQRAAKVYEGVPGPLLADDIAETIAWVASRPHHVNIDRLVVRPLAQAANHKVFRG